MALEIPTALETLVDRLAAFEPADTPVISLYLDTRPDERGRDHFQPFLRKELKARGESFPAASAERAGYERDADRIRLWLREELRPSANGVALFACDAAGLFEAVQLDVPIEASLLHVTSQPHVYPLVRVLDHYPRYAALIADSHVARLFVFGLGVRLRERTVENPKMRRSDMGGWSQMRYQRHVDDQYRRHAKEVVEVLERTVRQDGIQHVVIAGDEVIVPLLRAELPPHLAEKVVDVMALDIRTPEHEVLEATLETLRRKEADTQAERVQRLLDEYRAGGLAVVGVRATEAALALGQVHELLLSAEPSTLREIEEEDLTASADRQAGEAAEERAADPEEQADLADRLVKLARQTAAEVTLLEDPALLAPMGGVGALLRYRLETASGEARQA